MNIVNKLTIKHLKENKKRTLVTIIGVIISVAMIMGVMTIGVSFSDLMQRREIATSGEWHVLYKNVKKDKLKTIENDSNTDKVILNKELGYAKFPSKNPDKPYLYLEAYNKEGLESFPLKIKEGRLPQNPNEVVISSHIAANGKMNYKIGDVLNLDIGKRYSVSKNGNKEDNHELNQSFRYIDKSDNNSYEELVPTARKEYRVVGIIERPGFEQIWSPGYTVISYIDKNNISQNDNVNVYVKEKKLSASIYKDAKALGDKIGVTGDNLKVNNSLLKWHGIMYEGGIQNAIYGVATVVLIIIMIGSISLIYNAFAISVSERSRHLGMLSSVGATRKQKRKSILFEGAVIGAISIPIGIIAGIVGIAITGVFINPLIQNGLSIEQEFITKISPIAILISIVLSIITIYISAFIPAIRASRISPIDAIRQTKDVKLTNKKVKTSKVTRKIFGVEGEIALKNLKRNKRRYMATVFSLVISIVLFLTVSSFSLYTQKASQFTNKSQNYDVSINIPLSNTLDKMKAYDLFAKAEGVEDYSITSTINMESEFDNDKVPKFIKDSLGKEQQEKYNYFVDIISLDNASFEKYVKGIKGDINKLNDTKELTGILLNTTRYYDKTAKKYVEAKNININKGDTINLYNSSNENGIDKKINNVNLKVLEITNKLPMGVNYIEAYPQFTLVVSENIMNNLANTGFNKDEKLEYTRDYSRLLLKTKNALNIQSELDKIKKSLDNPDIYINNIAENNLRDNQFATLLKVFVYGFIALITAIVITNIFNTISTSMSLRKKEFAMLKSVGMTPKSFNKMVNYESIFYGIKALLYGLPLSFIVMILIYREAASGFQFEFTVPWGSLIAAIVGVFVVVGLSMYYSGRQIKKQNIIETLKQENI